MYQLTFEVKYNMTDGKPPTHECGEYYASQCLGSFLHTDTILKERCQSGSRDKVAITIITRATGKIINKQVCCFTLNLLSKCNYLIQNDRNDKINSDIFSSFSE